MKHFALLVFAVVLLAGCTTTSKYVSKSPAGNPKPEDYPIYIYTENVSVPRPFDIIGTMHIGDTPFTVIGGSLESVMNKLMNNARKKGADAVQLTNLEEPSFWTPNHRADANLLRFTDTWESISLPEPELANYFKTNAQTLDPIEGLWRATGAVESRVAILKSNSRPGRDFIIAILKSKNPSWKPGDKKAEVRHDIRRGVYRGTFYHDDYQETKFVLSLRLPAADQFTALADENSPVIFVRE